MVEKKCKVCGSVFKVVPSRKGTARFCSNECRLEQLHRAISGSGHGKWLGGKRWKKCQHCGLQFTLKPKQPITTFKTQKFCSRKCADVGGFRYLGKDHPNYREGAKRGRGREHSRWANAVLERDNATCKKCGISGIEMHAHHVKSYLEHPELRFDVSNGITVCHRCHWDLHTALNAKAVNSGNTPPGKAEGNPEPSLRGNLLEGVTTRGKPFRKWVGACGWCSKPIMRNYSDAKGKAAMFCGGSCRSKWIRKVHGPIRGNTSKSAAPERDEIV